MAHQLVFKSETGKPRTYPLAGGKISIGRHPKNTVVLDHASVSIYHAEVVVENGKALLRDLKSSNGTKLNSKRVSEAALTEGDEIRFGPIVCHFRGEIWFEESTAAPKNGATQSVSAKSDSSKKDSAKKDPPAKVPAAKIPPKKVPAVKLPVAKIPVTGVSAAQASAKKEPAKKAPPANDAPRKDLPKNEAAKIAAAKTAPAKAEVPAEPEQPLTFLQNLQRRLAESRYFMLSLVIHSAVVLLAGGIVLYKAVVEPPDFVAEGGTGLISPTDDLSPPPETPADSVPVEKVVQPTPSMNAPAVNVITTSTPSSNFKIAMPQVQVKITTNTASLTRALAAASRRFSGSLPGTMGGRVGAARSRAMALNGMKPKSEEAVIRGLLWLAQNQNPDGSWGDDNKGAMTGFGLLCFLGHGELQDSPQFGITVGKALTWVYENGNKNEGRLNMAKAFSQPGVYEHAICTYALGEYYTMTKDKRVTELFAKAIGHIIEGQGPGGGWMYSYDKSGDDISVSGWQIQALKAAHLSQIKIAGVDPALDKAVKYLERVKGRQGGYGYRDAADDYSLTGVGILCQLFWKSERGDLRKSMEWLLDRAEKSEPVKYKQPSADLYAWYYHTQACLMFGGEAWKKWNGWFQDEICDAQNADGSWPIPGGVRVGPQNNDNMTGAVYRSSLCILMLEVFYRYMPTTQG
jgi:hypothetical protein